MTSSPIPIASKIWAPVYEATVDTPILDMIFSSPLPSALIRLAAACRVVIPSSAPLRTRSSTDSMARYGQTQEAPYPISRAMWWHSRASAASTIRPTLVRVRSLIRWWCTAPVSSSDGIGARRRVQVAAVGEHDQPGPGRDRGRHLRPDLVQAPAQGRSPARDRVAAVHDVGGEAGQVAVVVDVDDLGEVAVADHRVRQHDLAAGGRARVEQVVLGTGGGRQRGDQFLPDGVQRRVGDLGEQLHEVVEDQARPVGQHGHGRVVAHRPERLAAGAGHGRQDDPQFLLGVPEQLLAGGQRLAAVAHRVLAAGQGVEVQQPGVQPVLVRVLGGQRGLDLLVLDDPARRGVGQEDPARLQPAPCAPRPPDRCPAPRPRWPARPGRRGSPSNGPAAARCGPAPPRSPSRR